MTKRLWIAGFLIVLLGGLIASFPLVTLGQTTVNLTVIDTPDNQAWFNGTWSAVLQMSPGAPPPTGSFTVTSGGGSVATQRGTLSSSGTASISLPANANILPSQTQWAITVCPQATWACQQSFVVVSTVSPQAVTISPPSIRINFQNATPPVVAYTDAEIVGASLGSIYYNTTIDSSRVCAGSAACTWSSLGGGIFNGGTVTGPTQFFANTCFQGPRPYYDPTCYGASGSAQVTTGNCNGTFSVSLTGAIDFVNGQGIAVYGCGPLSTLSAPTGLAVSQVTKIPYLDFAANPIESAVGLTCSGTTATATTRGWNGLTSGESVTIANGRDANNNLLSQYNITATITVTNQWTFTYPIASCPGPGGSYNSASPATITLNAGSTSYSYEVVGVDANNGTSAASSPVTISNANPSVTGQPQVGLSFSWNYLTGAKMYAVYKKIGAGAWACVGPANQPGASSVSPTFTDYGQTNSCPQNVPASPPPLATNGILVTSILSGAGTTSLVVANVASTTASGVTVQHEDSAGWNTAIALAAANTLPGTGGGGLVVAPTGYYNVQTLLFPTTSPHSSDTVKISYDGAIASRQPIDFGAVYSYDFGGTSGGAFQTALIVPTGASPEIHAEQHTRFSHLDVYGCPGDCFLFDPAANYITLDGVYAGTQNAGGFDVDCRIYGNGAASSYNYIFNGGGFYQNPASGMPTFNFEGCYHISFTGGPFFYGGGLQFIDDVPNVMGFVKVDGSGVFPETIPGPIFTFDETAETHGSTQISIEHVDPADTPTGADNTLVKEVGQSGFIQNVFLRNNYYAFLTEGNVLALDANCSSSDGNCTGLKRQVGLSVTTGTLTDNKGQTFKLSNTFYPNNLNLYASSTGNPFQIFSSPTGPLVSAVGPTGYHDEAEQAAPSNPAAGFERWFANNSTHLMSCLTSSGGNCAPSGGGGMVWPSGGAGIPNYSGSNSWGTSYSATNTIPFNFLNITYANVVGLWASGSCSGFLKNDGTCGSSGGGSAGAQYAVQYSLDGAGNFGGTTPPSTNGNYICGYKVVSASAVAPTCPIVGVLPRVVGGSTSTDTILFSDNAGIVEYQGSVVVAVSLPTPTTLGNATFVVTLSNYTSGSVTNVTVTAATLTFLTTSTSTLSIPQGQTCTLFVDPNGTQWDNRCIDQAMSSGTGIGLTRTQYGYTIVNTLPMVYPGAGLPISTGAAWGASLSETDNDLVGGSSGAWGKFALGGDCTLVIPNITCTKSNGSLFGTLAFLSVVTGTQLAAQYSKGSCTEVWGGTGTANAMQSGDDAIMNNGCYNDSGVTRTITAVKARSDNASNTTTVNPTFGSAGTGTTICSGALTAGNSYAYSSSCTVSNASWTTGTGIDPGMATVGNATSIAMIVEYTY